MSGLPEAVVAVCVRAVEALLLATPTLLVGLVVAGLLASVIGPRGTRRLFGEARGWRSFARAWVLGMLLPVCSVGVIPVMVALRRAGVRAGTILAFGLTAPLFNPLSVLYGLTFADPTTLLVFSLGSLVVVSAISGASELAQGDAPDLEPAPEPPPSGGKRMIALALHAGGEMAGPTALFVALSLVGSGLLAAIFPAGSLGSAANPANPWAPVDMALVAAPAYLRPLGAMTQLATVLQHGNSIGAGFSLLALGAGLNLGVVAWVAWRFGPKRTVLVLALLLVVVLALAYGVDRPLRPAGTRYSGHTHAFDAFCAPPRGAAQAWLELGAQVTPPELVGVLLLAALGAQGWGARRWDARLQAWLATAPAQTSRWDRALPLPILGGVALVGIVLASFAGCLVYFPPPRLALDDLDALNVEVCGAALEWDPEAAARWIPLYRDGLRRFHVGALLRGDPPTPYQRAKAAVLEDKLEALAHAVEAQDARAARLLSLQVERAFRRLRRAHPRLMAPEGDW